MLKLDEREHKKMFNKCKKLFVDCAEKIDNPSYFTYMCGMLWRAMITECPDSKCEFRNEEILEMTEGLKEIAELKMEKKQ